MYDLTDSAAICTRGEFRVEIPAILSAEKIVWIPEMKFGTFLTPYFLHPCHFPAFQEVYSIAFRGVLLTH